MGLHVLRRTAELWLIRIRNVKKVILTNGLVKKSQKLPVSEKKLAKKYKNDYERRCRYEQL